MRKIVFTAFSLFMMGVVVEGASFMTARLVPTLFDARERLLARFHADDLRRFRSQVASAELGWDNPAEAKRRRINCLGKEVDQTFGRFRERRHAGQPSANAVIVVAGDSYAFGDDVSDAETFPAVLEQRLGLSVANLGVRGYGPTQALLKLERSIDVFPAARVAVLSIMYDNVFRMVNSYRPVYAINTSFIYGFKPFMRDNAVQPLAATDPWRDLARFRDAANQAFDRDFWRKPKASFPYAWALAQAYTSPAGLDILLTNLGRLVGKTRLEMVFEPLGLRANLLALIERFAAFAEAQALESIVVLIPRNGTSAESGRFLVASLGAKRPAGVRLVTIEGDIDWSRFNLKANGGCHPSPYGYSVIADRVAAAIGKD